MSPRPTRGKGRKTRIVEKRRRGFDPSQPGRAAAWATGFALVFLFLSLLVLVLLPSRLERNVQDLRDEVREVHDPAERLAAKVQFSQARQREAFYSFLLLGDSDSRLRYREAKEAAEAALDTLTLLTEGMSVDVSEEMAVREDMAYLVPLSFSWHLGHQEMLSREITDDPGLPGGEVSAERLRTERAAYTEVLSAGGDLMDGWVLECKNVVRDPFPPWNLPVEADRLGIGSRSPHPEP